MSDQMSRHPYRTSESAEPEFQLVSEQASCFVLGEIWEGTFWSKARTKVVTEERYELGQFILLYG